MSIISDKNAIEMTQRRFEMEVEQAAAEVVALSKDVAKAIGPMISYSEAQEAILTEFKTRLIDTKSYYSEFKSK